jgi:hypothetical protein
MAPEAAGYVMPNPGRELVEALTSFDPLQRISAARALQLPFFTNAAQGVHIDQADTARTPLATAGGVEGEERLEHDYDRVQRGEPVRPIEFSTPQPRGSPAADSARVLPGEARPAAMAGGRVVGRSGGVGRGVLEEAATQQAEVTAGGGQEPLEHAPVQVQQGAREVAAAEEEEHEGVDAAWREQLEAVHVLISQRSGHEKIRRRRRLLLRDEPDSFGKLRFPGLDDGSSSSDDSEEESEEDETESSAESSEEEEVVVEEVDVHEDADAGGDSPQEESWVDAADGSSPEDGGSDAGESASSRQQQEEDEEGTRANKARKWLSKQSGAISSKQVSANISRSTEKSPNFLRVELP